MKQCIVCKESFPATTEYFYEEKRVKSGLKAKCKKCFLEESSRLSKGRKRKYQSQRKYIEDNKDHYKIIWSEYKSKNKDKIAKQKQQYYLKNKDKLVANIRKYQRENKDEILHKNGIYKRIRYTDESTNYSVKDWENCKNHFDNKCAYCGKRRKLTKEHFVPFQNGGEYSINNIIPACKSCNSSKYNKSFFEWYPLQEYYSKERERKILNYLGYKNQIQQLSIL